MPSPARFLPLSLHDALPIFAIVALASLAPATAFAWGSVGHHYIAQNYSQHLPPAIDGLKAWDSVVDAHVTDADTRKASTPGESYRHYIDIDWYPRSEERRVGKGTR